MKKRITKILAAASIMSALLFGGTTSFADASPGETVSPTFTNTKTVRVEVTDEGYNPSTISVERGTSLTIVFTRTTDSGCAGKVVFPALKISRNLPVGKPVSVTIKPDQSGEIGFTCGMGMYKGAVIAQ